MSNANDVGELSFLNLQGLLTHLIGWKVLSYKTTPFEEEGVIEYRVEVELYDPLIAQVAPEQAEKKLVFTTKAPINMIPIGFLEAGPKPTGAQQGVRIIDDPWDEKRDGPKPETQVATPGAAEVNLIKTAVDEANKDESSAQGRQSGEANPNSNDRQQDGSGGNQSEVG